MANVRQGGFSLVELLIAVAIIGILMTIALPNYNNYVLKGKLTEAMTVLSDLQAREEAYYTDNRAYTALSPRTGQVTYFETTSCTLPGGDSQQYLCSAQSAAIGYRYTVNEKGDKQTYKPGSATPVSCWLTTPNGNC